MKCVQIFLQLLSEAFLILRSIQRDNSVNVHSVDVKYLLFVSDFSETRPVVGKYSNIRFHKNLSIGSLAVQIGRQLHVTKLIVAFRNFCERA
jgi:hypothetical protein